MEDILEEFQGILGIQKFSKCENLLVFGWKRL